MGRFIVWRPGLKKTKTNHNLDQISSSAEEQFYLSSHFLSHPVLSCKLWFTDFRKNKVSWYLAAQPQRATMHAATWTAKGSALGVSPFLFFSSSISCSKMLTLSSVSDCKKTNVQGKILHKDQTHYFFLILKRLFNVYKMVAIPLLPHHRLQVLWL